jgi:hypothetical protein
LAQSDVRTTERSTVALLWEVCRPVPDESRLAAALGDGADVDLATGLARINRIVPMFWRVVSTSPVLAHALNDECRNELAKEVNIRRGHAAFLLPRAIQMIVQPLERIGIELLFVKGAALVDRYPSPELRPMDDIDAIVPHDQLRAAVRGLEAAGWTSHTRKNVPYETTLRHPDLPDVPLELHHGLHSWKERSTRMTTADLWRRRVPIESFGVPTAGLPPEEELVYVAAHAGKPYHVFERMLWFVDLAVIIESAKRLDWNRMMAFAHDAECQTVVAVGLHHARRIGANVPDEVVRFPTNRYRRGALAPVLDVEWPVRAYDAGLRRRVSFGLTDSQLSRMSLVARELTRVGAGSLPGEAFRFARSLLHRLWLWRRAQELSP